MALSSAQRTAREQARAGKAKTLNKLNIDWKDYKEFEDFKLLSSNMRALIKKMERSFSDDAPSTSSNPLDWLQEVKLLAEIAYEVIALYVHLKVKASELKGSYTFDEEYLESLTWSVDDKITPQLALNALKTGAVPFIQKLPENLDKALTELQELYSDESLGHLKELILEYNRRNAEC